MKKQILFRLTVLIFIGGMLLLSSHTHPHRFSDCGEDSDCFLSQNLDCGFTCVNPFRLFLVLIAIAYLTQPLSIATKILLQAICDGRAPPSYSLLIMNSK